VLNPGNSSNLLLTVAMPSSRNSNVLDVLGQSIVTVRSFMGKKSDKVSHELH
jgi:hypothetical protein